MSEASSAPAHGVVVVADAPARARKREHYEGPGTGRAWLRIDDDTPEIPVALMIRAAEPGEGASIGDLFLTIGGVGDDKPMSVRLDIGAKRFLFSLLEQALTLGDFSRGV